MSEHRLSEMQFRQLFIDWLDNQEAIICCEVPVFSRSVDLVLYEENLDKITAIEFKLNDWTRAQRQLFEVSICFDYMELCIPMPKTEKGQSTIIRSCLESGIGLYLYDMAARSFTHVVMPSDNHAKWDAQKRTILGYLKGYSNERCLEASSV